MRWLKSDRAPKIAKGAAEHAKDSLSATIKTAARRVTSYSLFDPGVYLRINADVASAGMEPYEHMLKYGCFEGRQIFDPLRIAKHVGQIVGEASDHQALQPLTDTPSRRPKIVVLYSALGNFFMHNVAMQLVSGLRRAGADAVLRDENSEVGEACDHRIIIAPHEFFYQTRGAKWRTDQILTSSFMLSTEQIQTSWYAESFPYLLASKGVVDMYFHSMRLLEQSGVPCTHYVPNPGLEVANFDGSFVEHPLFKALPSSAKAVPNVEDELQDRALDLCFVGAESPHRDKTLARCASTLAKHRCYFYYRRLNRGPIAGSDRSLVSLAAHASAHSKITLNLHRDFFGAFEWFRIVQLGMCSGSLVLTERGLPAPGFKAGVHYMECDARHMAEAIDWLLHEPDGKLEAQKVRRQASATIASDHAVNRQARGVLAFLEANR
jgi:hypothetical protein